MARNLNCNRYSCYSSETVTIIFAKPIDKTGKMCYNKPVVPDGGIAQLGERLNGIQEVRGSTPLISTKPQKTQRSLKDVLSFRDFLRLDGNVRKCTVRPADGKRGASTAYSAEASPVASSVPGRALSTSPSPTI